MNFKEIVKDLLVRVIVVAVGLVVIFGTIEYLLTKGYL
jgi:hypothetical protein